MGLLSVLHDVVFVFVPLVLEDVGIAAIAYSLQAVDVQVLLYIGDVVERYPSALVLLIGTVAAGHVAAFVVVAGAHEVEICHTEIGTVRGIVEVGETHAVGELMAERADAAEVTFAIQLTAAGIDIDIYFAQGQHIAIGCISEFVLVRPDGVVFTAVCLSHAGIEHEHLFHVAIVVPVVFGEVYTFFIVRPLAGFDNHRSGIDVTPPYLIVSSVIGKFVGKRTDAHHVKVEVEHATALRIEVVAHTALESVLGVVFFVYYLLVQVYVVVIGKLGVGKLSEDNQCMLRTPENALIGSEARCSVCLRPHAAGTGAGLRFLLLRRSNHTIGACVAVVTVACAVGSLQTMEMFVTHLLYLYRRAVGKDDGAPYTALGRYGMYGKGGSKEHRQQEKCPFHRVIV